jgi:hypothetical protein
MASSFAPPTCHRATTVTIQLSAVAGNQSCVSNCNNNERLLDRLLQVPWLMGERLLWVLVGLLACTACGGRVSEPDEMARRASVPGAEQPSAAAAPADGSDESVYTGQGFVVHEWGTNTIVVGSDGVTLPGLHHEEEGLPSFVYDRLRAAELMGPSALAGPELVDCKLETPVTYFYSAEPLSARVSVGFPGGIFTQWYPAVTRFAPLLARPCLTPDVTADPFLDPAYAFLTPACAEHFPIADGALDWGLIEVLPRNAAVDAELSPAPLDEFTWAHARQVAANPVRAAGLGEAVAPELERFLFYRGLGNFALPVAVRARVGGEVSLENNDAALAMGAVFLLNVGTSRAAYSVFPEGIGAAGLLELPVPTLDGGYALDTYSAALSNDMTAALRGTGLYADEASAMVETWKRQWFSTPGVRVLYLLPKAWTDRMIPLSIEPPPDVLVRTLVVRVEVIPPETETEDVARLGDLAAGEAERAVATSHFAALGRFAEPRLRRALSLAGESPEGLNLLDSVRSAETALACGE